MTTVVIVMLTLAALYFARRWIDAKSEVRDLQVQVALLKRRLTRVGR